MNLQEGLLLLVYMCEIQDVRLELSYDTGRYIPGKLINYDDPGAEPDPSTIRQGPKGWRVSVANKVFQDDEGNERLYPKLVDAVSAGHLILNGEIS